MSSSNAVEHEAVLEFFRRAAGSGRLGHAYLFVGPPGVGKRCFAVRLAQSLLCESAGTVLLGEPCGECPACLQVEAQTHPDYQLAALPDDRQEFPIDMMRQLLQHLALKPARGRHRILIVDDADTLSEEAANCFLKTLEEPPPAALLILLSVNRHRQLPTIRSRCQEVRFAAPSASETARRLLEEKIAPDAETARQLAVRSGGSFETARALADPEFGKVRRMLFDRLSRPGGDLLSASAELVKFVEDAGKDGAPRRRRAMLLLGGVTDLLGDALRLRSGQASRMADADDLAACRCLAERLDEEVLLDALERVLDAEYQVERRLQLALVLEAALDALGRKLH